MRGERMKNIKAAKKLIELYRKITLDEIKEVWMAERKILCGSGDARVYLGVYGNVIAEKLTGFGDACICLLCRETMKIEKSFLKNKNIKHICSNCIYISPATSSTIEPPCNDGSNKETFSDIMFAETPEKLLKAFRARANHIEEILTNLENKK